MAERADALVFGFRFDPGTVGAMGLSEIDDWLMRGIAFRKRIAG